MQNRHVLIPKFHLNPISNVAVISFECVISLESGSDMLENKHVIFQFEQPLCSVESAVGFHTLDNPFQDVRKMRKNQQSEENLYEHKVTTAALI